MARKREGRERETSVWMYVCARGPMHMPLARAAPPRARRYASIFELCTPRNSHVANLLLISLSPPFFSRLRLPPPPLPPSVSFDPPLSSRGTKRQRCAECIVECIVAADVGFFRIHRVILDGSSQSGVGLFHSKSSQMTLMTVVSLNETVVSSGFIFLVIF